MKTNRIVVLSTLLIAFALSINWLLEEKDRPESNGPGNEPDLYMLNAAIEQYDDEGQLRHTIKADRFTHFPLTDLTTMKKPLIKLGDDDRPNQWTISSNDGRLLPSSLYREEVIELWTSVIADNHNSDNEFVRIETESLTVYPARNYAETDRHVDIKSSTGRTSAAGMRAFFDKGQYHFYSKDERRVTTVFQPNT